MDRKLEGIFSQAPWEASVMNVGIAMRGEKKLVDMRLVAISFVLVGSEDTAPVSWSMVLWTPPNHVVLVDRAEDRNLPRRF
jgi:hypothetical protein